MLEGGAFDLGLKCCFDEGMEILVIQLHKGDNEQQAQQLEEK